MSGAIMQRELFCTLRRHRAIAMLVVLTICFSLIVLLRWPTDSRIDLTGARSIQVFQVFAYTLLAGVLFVVPAFPATSIVQEKNRGTLALLLNSPLNALAIYGGKFSGSFLFSILVLVTSLPAAAACYAMGGVDFWRQVALLYLVLVACVIQYTTVALLVSSIAQSSDAAVRVTYACVFALGVLAIGPERVMQASESVLAQAAWWLRAGSPIPAVMEIIGHGAVGDIGVFEQTSTIFYFFLITGLTSVIFAAITVSRLNYRIFDRNRSKGKITQERSMGVRIFRRLAYLVDPQSRKAGIPFYANPVMVKEFRTRRFGRFHWLLRLVSGCAVLSLLLALSATTGVGDWGADRMGGILVLLQIALIILIVPSLTAGLISTERETGGWEILRMTPMSVFKIVRGKLSSVIWTVCLILLATLPGYVMMIWINPAIWLQVQQVLICLALAAIYTVCVGAAVGALFRKTAAATMACYTVVILAFLGPLLMWMGRDAPFSYDVVRYALSINPTGAALGIIGMEGFGRYDLVPLAWWMSGGISIAALLLLLVQVWRISRPV